MDPVRMIRGSRHRVFALYKLLRQWAVNLERPQSLSIQRTHYFAGFLRACNWDAWRPLFTKRKISFWVRHSNCFHSFSCYVWRLKENGIPSIGRLIQWQGQDRSLHVARVFGSCLAAYFYYLLSLGLYRWTQRGISLWAIRYSTCIAFVKKGLCCMVTHWFAQRLLRAGDLL